MREPEVSPPLRSDLAAIPRYVAGRGVPSAEGKLSSNELAQPPLPAVVRAAAHAAAASNRYPDIVASALTERLGELLGTPQDRIVAGAGSLSVLQQVLLACVDPGRAVVFAWRSYEAYPIVVRSCHAVPRPVPLLEHRHDLAAMAAEVQRREAAMVVVCNPNNPTGTALHHDELTGFLDAVPATCVVVIDEAYREFVTDPAVPDAVRLARGRPNVVVLRTFSKAHALAGARVGYAVAPPRIADAVRAVTLPFAVSGPAEAAALAALDEWPTQQVRVHDVASRRDALWQSLLESGVWLPPSQANFVWVPDAALADPARWRASLDRAGICVREFRDEGWRITIGAEQAIGVVKEALVQTARGSVRS
jgi:histidinol-phosphate aminotransferase